MDLRGLAPEDIINLLNTSLNMRQIDGQEARAKVQEEYNRQRLELDRDRELRQLTELEMKSLGLTPSAIVNVNGYQTRQWHDIYGNVVRTDVLGPEGYKPDNSGGTWMMTPDGRPLHVKPGEEGKVPLGSRPLSDSGGRLKFSDQVQLASFEGIIQTGEDSKNTKYPDETRAGLADLYNKSNPDNYMVNVVPRKTTRWLDGISDVEPVWIKVPKAPTSELPLPDGVDPKSVIAVDDETGKPIYLYQIEQLAQQEGISVQEVMKYFNLIK